MVYIKQLDALRAIAVILVIIWHWFPQESLINRFPNGFLGVDIFFVLSGFLITSILLEQKDKVLKGCFKELLYKKEFKNIPNLLPVPAVDFIVQCDTHDTRSLSFNLYL